MYILKIALNSHQTGSKLTFPVLIVHQLRKVSGAAHLPSGIVRTAIFPIHHQLSPWLVQVFHQGIPGHIRHFDRSWMLHPPSAIYHVGFWNAHLQPIQPVILILCLMCSTSFHSLTRILKEDPCNCNTHDHSRPLSPC